MNETEDNTLRDALAEGREEAYARLYDLYGAALYRVALAVTGRAADAEDAVQGAFVGLVRARERLSRVRALRPYVFAMVRNPAQRRRRRTGHASLEQAAAIDGSACRTLEAVLAEGRPSPAVLRAMDMGGPAAFRLAHGRAMRMEEALGLSVFANLGAGGEDLRALLGEGGYGRSLSPLGSGLYRESSWPPWTWSPTVAPWPPTTIWPADRPTTSTKSGTPWASRHPRGRKVLWLPSWFRR